MDSIQNFNNYTNQNFNPLFCFNGNSYINQNNNNFNQFNGMNQINNNINFNMNNLNQMNQMNNNFNMNIFNQMNNNNINFNMNNNCNNNFTNQITNNNDKIIDLFPYIKEEKKLIKFTNSDYISRSIKIPISITKNDLYSIANNYTSHPTLKFKLSYKNIMIKEDESSIEEIPEGAEINIIEERPIPNTCYYDKLKKKYGNNDIRNIYFSDSFGKKKVLNFPGAATISDIKIAYNNIKGYNENMLFFIFEGLILKDNDEKMLKELSLSRNIDILAYLTQIGPQREDFGKALSGNVVFQNKEISNFKIKIGSLESTSRLYSKIIEMLPEGLKNKIKKLYLNNKEINREDEQSLISLGIKEDFNVIVGI